MAFSTYQPRTNVIGKENPRHAGISVSMRMVKGHGAPTMNISFLPALNQHIFGGEEAAPFKVYIGDGDDFGKIRISRSEESDANVTSIAMNRCGGSVYHSIKLRAIRNFGYQSQAKQTVVWNDLGEGVIEITLPKWVEAFGKVDRKLNFTPIDAFEKQIRLIASSDLVQKDRKIIKAGLDDKLREERERLEADQRRLMRGCM